MHKVFGLISNIRLSSLGLFLLFLSIFYLPCVSNTQLESAQKAYDAKKYKEAIFCYESLINEGYQSYELYFNLGNAYFRNNEIGKAIYNYERAKKIEPNDEDVTINLAKANSKTIDQIDTKENFFISAVKTNILSSLSTKTWAWLSISFIFLASFSFVLFKVLQTVVLKRVSFISTCVLAIAFSISYLLGYSALKAKNQNKFGVILAREVKVMNEPTTTAISKFTLHEGTKIRLVENNGDWGLIKLDNGNEGWVKLTVLGVI